jgi:hypothetical protein
MTLSPARRVMVALFGAGAVVVLSTFFVSVFFIF